MAPDLPADYRARYESASSRLDCINEREDPRPIRDAASLESPRGDLPSPSVGSVAPTLEKERGLVLGEGCVSRLQAVLRELARRR